MEEQNYSDYDFSDNNTSSEEDNQQEYEELLATINLSGGCVFSLTDNEEKTFISPVIVPQEGQSMVYTLAQSIHRKINVKLKFEHFQQLFEDFLMNCTCCPETEGTYSDLFFQNTVLVNNLGLNSLLQGGRLAIAGYTCNIFFLSHEDLTILENEKGQYEGWYIAQRSCVEADHFCYQKEKFDAKKIKEALWDFITKLSNPQFQKYNVDLSEVDIMVDNADEKKMENQPEPYWIMRNHAESLKVNQFLPSEWTTQSFIPEKWHKFTTLCIPITPIGYYVTGVIKKQNNNVGFIWNALKSFPGPKLLLGETGPNIAS